MLFLLLVNDEVINWKHIISSVSIHFFTQLLLNELGEIIFSFHECNLTHCLKFIMVSVLLSCQNCQPSCKYSSFFFNFCVKIKCSVHLNRCLDFLSKIFFKNSMRWLSSDWCCLYNSPKRGAGSVEIQNELRFGPQSFLIFIKFPDSPKRSKVRVEPKKLKTIVSYC